MVALPIANKKVTDDAVAGAFAGATARMLTAPFDVIKIRFQLQGPGEGKYKTMLQAFRTVVLEEGVPALWKGNLSATLLWVSYMAAQFTIYGILKRIGERTPNPFRRDTESDPIGVDPNTKWNLRSDQAWKALMLFLAGSGAGMASVAATYPFDIMRTQFALQGKHVVYKSMGSFISHTYHARGVTGFYAGLTPAVVGITPQMGLNFALYETFKQLASGVPLEVGSSDAGTAEKPKRSFVKGTMINGLCGGLGGGLSKIIVYPLDTVKKRLQAQVLTNTMSAHVQALRYDGFLHCFHTIHSTEGYRGFYRGIVATTAKSVASTAITFAAYEVAKDFLARRNGEALQRDISAIQR